MATPLTDIFGFRKREFKKDKSRWPDLFGIELELEGIGRLPELVYWTVVPDNSLRNGMELVLNQPYASLSLEAAMDEYFGANIAHQSTIRTSTHIHINATDMTLENVRSLFMIVYMIEEAIFAQVGEARKWSGYCMGLNQMEPARIRGLLGAADLPTVALMLSPQRNQERYYGLNVAVKKHGTVELRYFPGGPDREELSNWLDLTLQLKRAACAKEPSELIDCLGDTESIVRYVTDNFSEYWVNAILRHLTPEYMLRMFEEVAALAEEGEQLQRREQVVFLNKPFISYVKKNLLADAGRKYLDEVCSSLNVVTYGDWWHYFRMAQSADGKDVSLKPKTMTSKKGEKLNYGGRLTQPGEQGQFARMVQGAYDLPRAVDRNNAPPGYDAFQGRPREAVPQPDPWNQLDDVEDAMRIIRGDVP